LFNSNDIEMYFLVSNIKFIEEIGLFFKIIINRHESKQTTYKKSNKVEADWNKVIIVLCP
jgi:hypothetical protein